MAALLVPEKMTVLPLLAIKAWGLPLVQLPVTSSVWLVPSSNRALFCQTTFPTTRSVVEDEINVVHRTADVALRLSRVRLPSPKACPFPCL